MKLWYIGEEDRREEENRLQRIAREADQVEEGVVNKWLRLADHFFGRDDDDPNPQAA